MHFSSKVQFQSNKKRTGILALIQQHDLLFRTRVPQI